MKPSGRIRIIGQEVGIIIAKCSYSINKNG
jgi:hypothetical protein